MSGSRDPIYMFVKDLNREMVRSNVSLRQLTGPIWTDLTGTDRAAVVKLNELLPGHIDEPSVGSLSEEDLLAISTEQHAALLESYFDIAPAEREFIILSSNIFDQTEETIFPAEIGAVRCSLRKGIIDSFGSLVYPGDIPVESIKTALEMTGHHGIPHDYAHFPDMTRLFTGLHALMHSGSSNGSPVVVFIEDDEYKRTSEVLTWMQLTSAQLGLAWNVKSVRLSTLWWHLMYYSPNAEDHAYVNEEDEFAFKTSTYDYVDLCSFHHHIDCAHCAHSKSHAYAYTLFARFSSFFDVEKFVGRHKPIPMTRWFE